jgi:nitroreductase
MVRDFDDRPLSPQVTERIIANGLRTPSAGFTQGTELLVLESAADRARYWDACFPPERRGTFRWPGVLRAPLLIVPMACRQAYVDRYAQPDKAGRGAEGPACWDVPYWYVDAAFSALTILLSAVDAGLGALLFRVFRPEAVAAEFGVPAQFRPVGAIAVGHPRPHPPSPSVRRGRRPLSETVHRGRW